MRKKDGNIQKESLSKKILLAATAFLAVLCMLFLFQSIQGMTAKAAQSGTVVSKKLLEDGTYKGFDGNDLVGVFQKEDNSAYKVMRYDGSTITIDNKDGLIENLSPYYTSAGVGYQLLLARDANGKYALLNDDGSFLGGKKEFHEGIDLMDFEKNKDYYYVDSGNLHICKADGSEEYTVRGIPEEYSATACYFGEYYGINMQHSSIAKYLILSKQGDIIKSGTGYVHTNYLDDYTEEENGNRIFTLYDTNLNVIEEEKWQDVIEEAGWNNKTYHNELAPNIRRAKEGEGPSGIPADDVYVDKVITIGDSKYYHVFQKTNGYAGMFVNDAGEEAPFPYGYFIGDHIIAVEDENGYWNALELSVAQTGAANVQIKEDGSANASLIAAGTTDVTFELNATKGILSEGCIFKVVKLEDTNKALTNAKDVLKKLVTAERVAVYDISLINSNNEKTQPNGTLSITTVVPAGFDTNKIGVYRINDDNSYTELKSTVSDGKVTFETDHFSTYVIAEKTVVTSPKTGDAANGVLWLTLLAATVVVLFSRKLWKKA